jgi:hypothetical protein
VIPETLESAKICEAAPLIVVPKPLISTCVASRRKTSTKLSPPSLVRVSAVPLTAATTFPERSDRTSRTSATRQTWAKSRYARRGRRRDRIRSEFHVSDLNGLESFMVRTFIQRAREMRKKPPADYCHASCGSSQLNAPCAESVVD